MSDPSTGRRGVGVAAAPSGPALREAVTALARSVGFDLAGVAPARSTPETRFLREWIARGYAGDMDYLVRRVEERVDPRRVLEGARSIVVVGLAHREEAPDPGSVKLEGGRAQVASYARGDDYHDLMLDGLRELEAALDGLLGFSPRTRSYVDTGPVAERVFAAEAGLGWIGKNGMLIHPELGSYLLLGVMLTDLDMPPDARLPDRCGTCRACLDACPTAAFEAPRVLDARRCIAYLTIEARGAIPEQLRPACGQSVFGCDVCQEACPWNGRAGCRVPPDAADLSRRLRPRREWVHPRLDWVLRLDEAGWRRVTRRSALRRTKYRGLLRNALVAAGNSGDPTLRPLLEGHARGEDRLVAEHAEWALRELNSGSGAAWPRPRLGRENR